MNRTKERNQRGRLPGIRAYLDLVDEHRREVASGRRVMWGHGRLSSWNDVVPGKARQHREQRKVIVNRRITRRRQQ